MNCFRPSQGQVKKPIIDLDDVIRTCAWTDVQYPVLCCGNVERCKRKNLVLAVDWNYMSREDNVTRFSLNKELTTKQVLREVCLFETVFENKSESDQQFTFKTSRQTVSSFELSVQEGICIGGNFNFAFSLTNPTGLTDDDKLTSSTVGGHVTWNSTSTEKLTKSETLTWGVDNQITVKQGESMVAKLGLREVHFVADLDIETTVTVTSSSGLIPVDVRRKDDNELIEIIDLSCKDLCRENENLVYDKEHPNCFKYKTSAICRAVYGAEQYVSVMPYRGSSTSTCKALACGVEDQFKRNTDITNAIILSN